MPSLSLGRQNRIAKRSEFRQVYDHGRKVSNRDFLAFCLRREDQEPTRIGLTTPRALGKATRRNRIRRRVREALRVSLWQLPVGWSLVFNPRRSAATRPFAELVREVEQVLERCAAP